MKKILIFPLLATLALSSCSTIPSTREDLQTMEQPRYEDLQRRVSAMAEIASSRIAQKWDAAQRDKARGVIANAHKLLALNELGEIGPTDLIRELADRYSDKLGLDEQARRDIKDVALLVDAAVGPIKLGVDGKLNDRELGLVTALLDGLARGLQ